jgi:N-acetylglutamate synthase-like GNAT family acetyltransferase
MSKILLFKKDEFIITTDKSKLDLVLIHKYLTEFSYWAQGRTIDKVNKSIENSLCFGIYNRNGQMAGFARVVTDYTTFGWVCDVFVLDEYKGRGLGKWLIKTIVGLPELNEMKRLILATRDAHELYRKYGGFQNMQSPERWMERLSLKDGWNAFP